MRHRGEMRTRLKVRVACVIVIEAKKLFLVDVLGVDLADQSHAKKISTAMIYAGRPMSTGAISEFLRNVAVGATVKQLPGKAEMTNWMGMKIGKAPEGCGTI